MDLQRVSVTHAQAVRAGGISGVSLPFVTLQRAQVEEADKQRDGLFRFERLHSVAEGTY